MPLFPRLLSRTTGSQQPALSQSDLDAVIKLMIVAMYSDRTVTAEENDRINAFMDKLGLTNDLQRRVKLPTLIAEVRRDIRPGGDNSAYVKQVASGISSADARLLAAGACNDVIRADGVVSDGERAILTIVISALGVQ
jgi:uncharacterized tellurite resistance protein B-like protein